MNQKSGLGANNQFATMLQTKKAVHKKRPISPNSIAQFSHIFIKKKREMTMTIEMKRKGVRKRRRR